MFYSFVNDNLQVFIFVGGILLLIHGLLPIIWRTYFNQMNKNFWGNKNSLGSDRSEYLDNRYFRQIPSSGIGTLLIGYVVYNMEVSDFLWTSLLLMVLLTHSILMAFHKSYRKWLYDHFYSRFNFEFSKTPLISEESDLRFCKIFHGYVPLVLIVGLIVFLISGFI